MLALGHHREDATVLLVELDLGSDLVSKDRKRRLLGSAARVDDRDCCLVAGSFYGEDFHTLILAEIGVISISLKGIVHVLVCFRN